MDFSDDVPMEGDSRSSMSQGGMDLSMGSMGHVSMPMLTEAPQYPPMPCCVCGVMTEGNPARMCVACLKTQVDITEGIPRTQVLPRCRECGKYNRPPWMFFEPESRELLALCLRKIKGLGQREVKLVDAKFLFTEPHSNRLKVQLTLEKEIAARAQLQQNMVVEFIIQNQQCDACRKTYTPHTWVASVQVRQRAGHKRTMLFLEQLILKHKAQEHVINVVDKPDGLDFHFGVRHHANHFVQFVSEYFPLKIKESKQLVSHDSKNNTASQKHTISLDICPVCKDDLVFLRSKVASLYGGVSPLMLVRKISTQIHLIDPFTLRGLDIVNEKYWKYPFETLCARDHLTPFIVLDVQPVDLSRINVRSTAMRFIPDLDPNMAGSIARKYKLVDVEIARAADFGVNDERIVVRTHLGQSLKEGHMVAGYDLRTINPSGYIDEVTRSAMENRHSDVILVKRIWPSRWEKSTQRGWVLATLAKETEEGGKRGGNNINLERDLEEFKRDLEEDLEMRREVNIFRHPKYTPKHIRKRKRKQGGDVQMADASGVPAAGGAAEVEEEDDDEPPEVDLCDLMEALVIDGEDDEVSSGVQYV